jgi:predicted ribosome quality control (RQC) complex YloA/Tae2 family protein
MRELYTLELIALVEELRSLEGFYIDQFYELGKNRFRLRLSKKGEKANLQIMLPNTVNRTEYVEIREDATAFTMGVRKRISGFLINKVEQFNKDRIILLKTKKADQEINIILEMFGRGNLIFADSDMKILLAYQTHQFKDRSIKTNAIYIQPTNQSIMATDKTGVEKTIKDIETSSESTGTLQNYITKRIGIGSMYASEAIKRSGMEPGIKLNEIKQAKIKDLSKSFLELVDECICGKGFTVYIKNDYPVDFSLCKIEKYSEYEKKEFTTLESGLDFFYYNAEKSIQVNEDAERVRASIEKQREILKEIDNEILQNKQFGNYIMNNMHELNSMIQKIKSDKNIKNEDLQKTTQQIEILSIDMKNKTVRIRAKDTEK